MGEKGKAGSVLAFYKDEKFNPVPIGIEDKTVWNEHRLKRINLYERHLGIPLQLIRGRSVIEFGCNSGENSLVLAGFGADLTLVEPNEQVLPRLKELYDRFKMGDRIKKLANAGIGDYKPAETFDLAIAEGFLYTMKNRDAMLREIVRLLSPGGIGVISFNDRYGMLFEFIKRMVFWRACRLARIDPAGNQWPRVAIELFGDDFKKLKTSRTLEVWCKDTLINPFIVSEFMWTYQELLDLVMEDGCVFLGSSPRWSLSETFNWYKNASSGEEYSKRVLMDWKEQFAYILTGLRPEKVKHKPVSDSVLKSVTKLVQNMTDFASTGEAFSFESISFPAELADYLKNVGEPLHADIAKELVAFFKDIKKADYAGLIKAYRKTARVRSLWGTPYHYLSFIKPS